MIECTAEGRAFRILAILDEIHPGECLAILVDRKISSLDIIVSYSNCSYLEGYRSTSGPITGLNSQLWL